MKTKKSKKLLAAFLAVIMVISCFAAMPFNSFAATYSKEDLKTLLDQYEAKVENGKVYTNLANSYEAWYNAYVTYICVTAGTLTENSIDTVYNTLQTQMGKMTEWTPYTATTTAAADGSYNKDMLVDGDVMSNVLYAYGVGENAPYKDSEASDGFATYTRAGVQYGSTVLLYDGITSQIGFPVTMYTARRTGLAVSRTRSMRPTSDNFALTKLWHGQSKTAGYQTNTTSVVGYTDNDSANASQQNAENSSPFRYSNTLFWTGNSDTFGSAYSLTYNSINWLHFNDDGNSSSFDLEVPIYVINYAPLINSVKSCMTDNLCEYTYSTAKALFTAIDKATAVNPQTYIVGSDLAAEVATCASAIENAVNTVNTAKSGIKLANNASYITLANNFNAYTPVAKNNNSDGYYTKESFDEFLSKYNDVKTLINKLNSKSVRIDDATANNEALTTAYRNLKADDTEPYIDDSELQTYFAEYYALHSSYYTPESYSAATEKINAALKYYNGGKYTLGITLKENEEDRAIYETIFNDVKTAMEGIRISRDAQTAILGELRSYNSITTFVSGLDGSLYSNYSAVMDEIGACRGRMTELDETPFTNEAEKYGEYVDILTDMANAILKLQYAFTSLSDGTIIQQTVGSTNGYDADNVQLFLNNAITNIVYFKTEPGTKSYTTEYDLTISNHWQSLFQYRGLQMHGLGLGGYGQDTVPMANGSMKLTWKEGGAAAENFSGSYTYHTALMKGPDAYTAGQDYINIPGNSNDNKILGETTVTVNDLGIASQSYVTPDLYTLFYCDGEERQFVNTDVKQTVTVVDVSDLFEKVDEAIALVNSTHDNAYKCYTDASWSAFISALNAAQANMDYSTMSVDQIVSEAKIRYSNLDTTMGLLVQNTDEGSHEFVAQDDNKPATCYEAGHIHLKCSVCGYEIEKDEPKLEHIRVTVPNNDGATHTIKCTRDGCDYAVVETCTPDSHGGLYCEVCKQALYKQANWEAFNEARDEMEALLAQAAEGSVKYDIKAYETIKVSLESLSYYNYTEDEEKTVPLDNQKLIDNQTTAIEAAVDTLKNGIVDESVYEALLLKVKTLNADAYNVSAVQKAVEGFVITQQIDVNGKEYTGYKFEQYNMTLGTALSENAIDYTVTVYDYNGDAWYLVDDEDGTYSYTDAADNATKFHYGDYVTAPNPNSTNPKEACAWASLAQPKSMSDSVYNQLTAKYQLTDKSYSFNIRGNMELYTTASATNDENSCKLTFVQVLDGVRTGKVLDVQYAELNSKFNITYSNVQDNVPFYQLSKYTSEDGSQTYSRSINVTGDMVILVNYVSLSPSSYTVKLVGEDGGTLDTQYPIFNQKVTLKTDGAVAYVNDANGKVLCYGSEYSFYACQDITVKAVTSIDKVASTDVISAPVIDDNGKVYIIGSFALPEGCKIKSYGIILNAIDSNDTDLSLADVNSANYIYNFSASKYTCSGQNGNQFVISFNKNNMFRTGTYVAYAIYEDKAGNELYAYSNVVTNATIYK